MKRIGPELKMPKLKGGEMKVPAVVGDVYYDLRDRRLLPLVALIIVAIVATPFLLARGSEEPEAEALPAPGALPSSVRKESLAVVEVNPGLRDYRKRLAQRKPTDPFHQRFTGPMLEGASLQSETPSTSTTPSGGTGTGKGGSPETSTSLEGDPPVTSAPPVEPVGSGGSGGGDTDEDGDGIPDGSTLYTYVLDLQITRTETKPNGAKEKIGPKLRKDVKAPTTLPGEKAPVVTYLGLGAKSPRRPLFLISPDVTAVYGEADCVAGTDTCQLIALEPGFAVTFVYGENDVRYKINVLDITPAPVEAPK
jgi:hypothetical protein